MGVPTESRLASSLRISIMRLSRRMRQERSSPLSQSEISALATMERHGPTTLGDLAALERVQPPSLTRVVSSLVAAGLATRTPHPTDGRQVVAAVTDAGKDLLAADRRRRDEWLAARLADLDPDELDALRRAAPVLDRLANS